MKKNEVFFLASRSVQNGYLDRQGLRGLLPTNERLGAYRGRPVGDGDAVEGVKARVVLAEQSS